MIRLTSFCGPTGDCTPYVLTAPDDAQLPTAIGTKRADEFVDSTKAYLTVYGHDVNGHVVYYARYGGVWGNSVRVRHVAGLEGPAYADRALQVAVLEKDVTVTFGTNQHGVVVVPTANQVRALIEASAAAAAVVSVSPTGTGEGLAGTVDYSLLQDGEEDGDWLKLDGVPPVCRRVALAESL